MKSRPNYLFGSRDFGHHCQQRDIVQERMDQICEGHITVRPKDVFEMTPTECWYDSRVGYYFDGDWIQGSTGPTLMPRGKERY